MRISAVRGFIPAPENGKPGNDGRDSVSVELSSYAIAAKFREGIGFQTYTVDVSVIKGDSKVRASDFTITLPSQTFNLGSVSAEQNGDYMRRIIVKLADGRQGAASISLVVQYAGVNYYKTITVSVTKDGDKGDPGADAYTLDLDNEMDSVPCSVNLKTSAPSNILYTTLTLYKGSTAVDMGDVSIERSNSQIGVSHVETVDYSKKYKVQVYDNAGIKETVKFSVVVNGVKHVATFSVNKIKPGADGATPVRYWVEPSVTCVKVSTDGVVTPERVTCKRMKQVGNQTPAEASDGYLCVKLPNDSADYGYYTWYMTNTVNLKNYGSIEFVLYKSMDDLTVLDRETVPVIFDGKKGDQGEPGDSGEDGNGIRSQTNYYIATTLREGVTPSNPSSGWVAEKFQVPTELKPYTWRFTRTVYTKNSAKDSPCELIATYQAGTNPNLLDCTTFDSDDDLDAWDNVNVNALQPNVTLDGDYKGGVQGGDSALYGHNAFRGGSKYSENSLRFKEILRQPVLKKLKPSTWYTLSYWMACYADSFTYIDIPGTGYPFQRYKVHLKKGYKYELSVTGFVSQEAYNHDVSLQVYVYDDAWSWSRVVEITTTSASIKTIQFDNVPADGEYNVAAYSYPTNNTYTVTLRRLYLRCLNCHTIAYVFPNCIDTNVKGFVDGKETSLSGDGAVYTGAGSYKFHTFTFKTKDTLPTDNAWVLFRLMPALISNGPLYYTDICMPKLEVGMMFTGYIPSVKDLRGNRGPALRGPQYWDDLPVGYNFMSGEDGDLYFDVVIYKDNFYSCHENHAKTKDNYPTSQESLNKNLWKVGDRFDIVATKLLLAEYAVIKNLAVENVENYDKDGNPLFVLKGGNLICKTGSFDNVTVSGIVKACLRYSTVKNIGSSAEEQYTVDPVKDPAQTFLVDGIANPIRIYLPKAADFEGVEFQFFQRRPITRVPTGVYIYAAENDFFEGNNENNIRSNFKYIEIDVGKMIEIKSLDGKWFVTRNNESVKFRN